MSASSDDSQKEIPALVVDVFEAAGAIRRRANSLSTAYGVSQARWELLDIVSDGSWTVAHAARRLGVTRQSVQRVANKLLEDGLLITEPNPNHKSSPLIRPTERALELLKQIHAGADDWRAEVARALTSEEIAAARKAMKVLVAETSSPADDS